MNKRRISILLLVLLLISPCLRAYAEGGVYTLQTQAGRTLTQIQGSCEKGDEYISGDNQHYRVITVNDKTATAVLEHIGTADMPDVSWLDLEKSTPVSAMGEKKIALYCTHSDESYIEGDGTESIEGKGGIYDVADALGKALENRGVTIEISHETHLPHDAGAYRRSRQTAMGLLKARPDAIFDVHRDGIPDPDEYAATIGNEKMSKVRLLVGKSNQNKDANLSFAKQIKAVGDQIYPGLIKDIYIGKGNYNQELYPQALLLEMGTHEIEKEKAMGAAEYMADVLDEVLFGGSAKAEETKTEKRSSAASGIAWAVGLAILAAVVFAIVSTGGIKVAGEKMKRGASELTGGLFGKKNKK